MRKFQIATRPRTAFGATVTAAIMLAVTGTSGAAAQTLAQPNTPTRSSPSSPAAKSLPMGREKSCVMYGAGFVYVPNSDTCIKIGGFAEVDGGVSRSR
ncbi:MAG: porin [Terriglobia bacterium]